ncbi:hypothetical protein ACHQM5_012520 [Ranunculus cassubicifolius]
MLLLWDKWKSSHPRPRTNENVEVNPAPSLVENAHVNPTPSLVPTLPNLDRGVEDNIREGQHSLKRTREDANDNETILSSVLPIPILPTLSPENNRSEGEPSSKRSREDEGEDVAIPRVLDLSTLLADPGLRKQICEFHPNDQDVVRRAYLLKGPFQALGHTFPITIMDTKPRSFKREWFTQNRSWLEYSIDKDSLFCLYCFLFKEDNGEQGGGGTYVRKGYNNWARKSGLKAHVGGPNSAHNIAYLKAQDFLKEKQHISSFIFKQSDQALSDYHLRLGLATMCVRYLLRQGLAFRGHRESKASKNQGNFRELVEFKAAHDAMLQRSLDRAPNNHKLTSHEIQKEIVNACAVETTYSILNDLGDAPFSILIDEARDVSIKEQMAIILRYVDKQGCVVERFLGISYVKNTNAKTLKKKIDEVFANHGLCISRLRGQGYDGASNMSGAFNGLKALIMKENESAFYIHCFAHQLQLALIAIVKKHDDVASLFSVVSSILNTVGVSTKRRDKLREANAKRVREALKVGAIPSGKGKNQEIGLKRAGDTRWGSHYNTLLNLIQLFPSVLDVLQYVAEDGLNPEERAKARGLIDSMQGFNFIFSLIFMKKLLAISNELSKALQCKDQDIVNAMDLVKVCKARFQDMRDNGWDDLLNDVSALCVKSNVVILKMEDMFTRGRSERLATKMTNLHYYHNEFFIHCIDWQNRELSDRFSETNTELLLCMASLDPRDGFVAFDKEKLIRFAQMYPADFSGNELLYLSDQLETYIFDVRCNDRFVGVRGVSGLARKMVETKKDLVYPHVYMLITLALTLPVATASVERVFSAMNIVKNRLRNRMGNNWMNDCLLTYIERDVFSEIDIEVIMKRFQSMGPRRGRL